MRITVLMENTCGARECLFEHGLSIYIETGLHRLLVDTGASDAFLTNAGRLGIDLRAVDTVVVSHGHYDHAGGVMAFSQINSHARIYIHRLAGEGYYHKNALMEKYIGMDPRIRELPQVEWVEGDRVIDGELSLFGSVSGRRLWPKGNRELMVKKGEVFAQDEFLHEQYLAVEAEGRSLLVSGCAHNGILNILDRYRERCGKDPDMVISGFHMSRKSPYREEDLELVRETAQELKGLNVRFYTGHCTGEIPFQILKEVMGNQVVGLHSGMEIQ